MQEKTHSWQNDEKIAPLTEFQLDIIYDISSYVQSCYNEKEEETEPKAEISESEHVDMFHVNKIETSQDFFKWYAKIEEDVDREQNVNTATYFDQLTHQKDNLHQLLNETTAALDEMSTITSAYNDISAKTTLLNEMSEQLYIDQSKLQKISEEINNRLYYFTYVTQVSQTLSLPSLSVSSANFFETLEKIDNSIEYMIQNNNYKESYAHLTKYKQVLYNVMFLIKNYVKQVFVNATEQALAPVEDTQGVVDPIVNSDLAFSLYYGKFQTNATKLKPIIEQLETRAIHNTDYAQLLSECQDCYLAQRMNLMNNAIASAVKQLVSTHKGDNSALFRTGCTFMLHVCQDETQLYNHFFKDTNSQLNMYLEKICTHLYDNLRPLIVHINHLETLAELCGILRSEIILENETTNDAFTKILWQLLQDVQERFVFRTHVYLQTDLLQYRPSAGDLAYPEKLQMMESIALSQMEDSFRSRTGSSPADLHGMWYPTVKRTLICLSRLYRCVDRPIFQGLSQEALTICVHTIVSASNMISARKTIVDGELFLIKHLLILREQIAPFQVDFTVKEMSLDFSKVKNAAFSLIQKRRQLFALNINNALLEFLLEGTPQVKEQLLDSRKEVDKQLKYSCEKFIKHCTNLLIGPILPFLDNIEQNVETKDIQKKSFEPDSIGAGIRAVQQNIKVHLPSIQKSMQLYLTNKETEFILFKLIRNNVMNSFTQLEQRLAAEEYTQDQLNLIACPTAEQMLVILSSASLVSNIHSTSEASSSQSPY